MTTSTPITTATLLERTGFWLRDHRRTIIAVQWSVVLVYATLLIVPVILPLPGNSAHIWNNMTVFARFVFWGIWWPGVLISMLLFGRLWCGVLCPEGALSEFASRHGRGRAIPGWIKWPGWPFTAFAMTTIYGQMVSVYQYPKPVLIVLGGSTVAAIIVGLLYGRDKRVWCRYLCPVNGVFGLLSKLAPMHYSVDRKTWSKNSATQDSFVCPPLVPVKVMKSVSPCHMCGRCSGFKDAVHLAPRRPNHEVVEVSRRTATGWDAALIITGLIGIAGGAFQWASSPWFVTIKQTLALWLIDHNIIWPLDMSLPWWLLTNYAGQNDVLSVLDGGMLIAYIMTTALILSLGVGVSLTFAIMIAGSGGKKAFYHLSHALIPIAACGVILGLSAQSITLLRADGFALDWVMLARLMMLSAASLWSLWLGWRIVSQYAVSSMRAYAGLMAFALALIPANITWLLLFWIW